MNLKYFAAFLLVGVLLFGCTGTPGTTGTHEYSGGQLGFEGASPSASASNSGILPDNLVDSSGKMVVKTGDVSVEVPRGTIQEKHAQLLDIVKKSGGEVYGTRYWESGSSKYYDITVKLPPAAFEAFPEQLKAIGTVKSTNTNVEDVTMQYVNLATKINNLEAERNRLVEMYSKSGNISDILQIERELTRVQSDLDYYTAQKLVLEKQVEKATLSVQLYEEAPVLDSAVIMPLSGLVNIFLGALQVGLVVITAIAGFGIPIGIALLVLYGIYKLLRKTIWKPKPKPVGKK